MVAMHPTVSSEGERQTGLERTELREASVCLLCPLSENCLYFFTFSVFESIISFSLFHYFFIYIFLPHLFPFLCFSIHLSTIPHHLTHHCLPICHFFFPLPSPPLHHLLPTRCSRSYHTSPTYTSHRSFSSALWTLLPV